MHILLAIQMRLMMKDEGVDGASLVEKQSLQDVAWLWHEWEIHFLILVSLFLQVFLFVAAGWRRTSSWWILRTLLWLAYLSADSVAVLVLGHLAVRASAPGNQLMAFWAPFVLVHLGGQDTMTAFSKQDNELWRRHLLSLVTQVAMAGYVVAKSSWPDRRLLASMAVTFVSGCIKYTERVLCLFLSSPENRRSMALRRLGYMLWRKNTDSMSLEHRIDAATRDMEQRLDMMSKGIITELGGFEIGLPHLSLQAPLNDPRTVLLKDNGVLRGMLQELRSSARCYPGAYKYVGELLRRCYYILHTKTLIRYGPLVNYGEQVTHLDRLARCKYCILFLPYPLFLPYMFFQYLSSLIALVLFWAAAKNEAATSRAAADITVSYVLLAGAVALDMCSGIWFIISVVIYLYLPPPTLHNAEGSRVRRCIDQLWCEELAQYSIIEQHVNGEEDGATEYSTRQWIRTRFGAAFGLLLEVTRTIPMVTKGHQSPIKKLILENLLTAGASAEWNIASSRGSVALRKFMINQDSDCSWTGRVLEDSTGSGVDFPTSVFIWHIATDMCYYHHAVNGTNRSCEEPAMINLKEHKEVCRQLSNYIMYLVFKCGVTLTTSSKLMHDKVDDEIRECFPGRGDLGEKKALIDLLVGGTVNPAAASLSHSTSGDEALFPQVLPRHQRVLPRAREVACELIAVKDESDRWGLIADVWSEMLYYAAPRCGAAFHYEKLSAGGEFATHVFLLMSNLGPFLPTLGDY